MKCTRIAHNSAAHNGLRCFHILTAVDGGYCMQKLLLQISLRHLIIQPVEEFVFRDHDTLAELNLGEAFCVDEFVGVCPGDTQELRQDLRSRSFRVFFL